MSAQNCDGSTTGASHHRAVTYAGGGACALAPDPSAIEIALQLLAALILLFEEWGWRPRSMPWRGWRWGLCAYRAASRGSALWRWLRSRCRPRSCFRSRSWRVPHRPRPARCGRLAVRRRQDRLDRPHRPRLPAHQAGVDADRLVRCRLQHRHALEGGALRVYPRVVGLALGAWSRRACASR